MTVKLKRVYEEEAKSDGKRILVDRVWPRGVSKEKANLYEWLKEIGPSKELRQWFNHDPDKFQEFKKKYKAELQDGEQKASYDKLKAIQKENSTITLIFSAKDEENNQEQVLNTMLEAHLYDVYNDIYLKNFSNHVIRRLLIYFLYHII